MANRGPGRITPTFVARSSTSLVRFGTAALGVGLAFVVVATLVFGFVSRIDGRVEVSGVIQAGYPAGQAASNTKQAAGYGIYQVEYSIDGIDHVGFVLGRFSVGQQVQLKAPADGSPYERLALADSMLSKILSWLFMAIGLALAVGGAVWLTRGMIARSAQIRADVRRTYGLPATSAPTLAGRPLAGPPPSRIPEDGSVPPRGFFTAPYDI